MVKSVLGQNRGFSDWVIQRISAIVMVLYTLGMVSYIALHPHLDYPEWHYLFSHYWMKTATLLLFLLLMYHAWIGLWTVLTDYVKPYILNLFLQAIIFLFLLASFIASIQIVWGI